jgi:phospholipase/carboxylesterase
MALLSGPRVRPQAGGAARQLLVLLHGVGADGDDLIRLAPALARRLPHAAFVAPNGPEPCDMAPFGRQWFSLRDRREMALHGAPRRRSPIGAVLGFSGALVGAEALAAEAVSRPPVLLIHGDADEVVPVHALFAAIAGLQAAGIAVQWSIREGLPHAIDPESIEHGADFLDAAFRDAFAAVRSRS